MGGGPDEAHSARANQQGAGEWDHDNRADGTEMLHMIRRRENDPKAYGRSEYDTFPILQDVCYAICPQQ